MNSYVSTFSLKRLWVILSLGLTFMFGTLLYFGGEIYRQAPPIPASYEVNSGKVLYTRDDILRGQTVWQSTGGMQQGSIWGHGSYLAPDWSADWLHREALALRKYVDAESAVRLMRSNTYDPTTEKVVLHADRGVAIAEVASHYRNLFTGASGLQTLRRDYAFPVDAILTVEEADALAAFVFWTAWAASTERPGDDITYTSNWPHEPLVGNEPTPSVLIWSLASVFLLLAGVGALVWYYVGQFDRWRSDMVPLSGVPESDPLAQKEPTPSMRATLKYFWVVAALFALQVLLGIITAHYAVEGQGLYGMPLMEYIPYVLTRTWHTQLAVLWIATAWLAAGLYVAPLLSGYEPKYQRLGVNTLFISLLVIVVGSFAGQALAVHRAMELDANFWLGHQGYEYVDLGRFWQIFLFVGLLIWLGLMLRALWPVLKGRSSLLMLVLLSATAIGLLYGAGLMYGEHTHISIMEYWRWWVVHLWVEGVFEVFATAVISILFVRMGLVRESVAATMVMLATIIFLFGGVLGTFHHLYWSGTPVSVMSLGAVFSALEVVPLLVVGFEAYNHAQIDNQKPWQNTYRWPLMFFSAVLFWNLVGAGLFGFLINPPIALYYMQGLTTTANHGHAALFGVYGMLGLGLMLFCMRGMTQYWDERLLKIGFWSLNVGLAAMTFLSLLPQGMWQTYASIKHGYAYARSAEFMHSPIMEGFVWARVPGDVIFAIGVAAIVLFVVRTMLPRQEERVQSSP